MMADQDGTCSMLLVKESPYLARCTSCAFTATAHDAALWLYCPFCGKRIKYTNAHGYLYERR